MSIDLAARADTVPAFEAGLSASTASFEVIGESRCGLEVRHRDGAIFAFMLNAAHTGLVDCRRPYEGADHELYRAAARRFAQTHAHEAGLIFCRKAA
ncbi:MAG: hypothetical protein JWN07_1040 [Hyphomicrobiales bacterium]|nr:hypothetical protein [Hyphomicrobiales bacterium]